MSLNTYTIAEISQITHLAPHTLRYYEQQFPNLLKTERSKGGHRIYHQSQLDTIKKIIHLLKEEKISIKQARQVLGEPERDVFEDNSFENLDADSYKISKETNEKQPGLDIALLLVKVLEKLDYICKNNDNRDKLLMRLIKGTKASAKKDELMEQLTRTRKETRETVELYKEIMRQGSRIN